MVCVVSIVRTRSSQETLVRFDLRHRSAIIYGQKTSAAGKDRSVYLTVTEANLFLSYNISVVFIIVHLKVSLTPNAIIKMNILKKTRKTKLLANAIGRMPKKVVAAPSMTDGPTSPRAFAIWASLGVAGL